MKTTTNIRKDLIDYTNNINRLKNDPVYFIEHFCCIKDKKTNTIKPIKLSNLQKEFIKYLNNYGKLSN